MSKTTKDYLIVSCLPELKANWDLHQRERKSSRKRATLFGCVYWKGAYVNVLMRWHYTCMLSQYRAVFQQQPSRVSSPCFLAFTIRVQISERIQGSKAVQEYWNIIQTCTSMAAHSTPPTYLHTAHSHPACRSSDSPDMFISQCV